MAVAHKKVNIPCDIKRVWDTVTSLTKYQWRSDLSKIEVLDETHFKEITKDGYSTNFAITVTKPYERWEFDMENNNMKGHWIGLFVKDGNGTVIDFTEEVEAKKIIMKPFVKGYLMKQQEKYVKDLLSALL